MKNHYGRDDHPAGARRLNKHEQLVTWEWPVRPDWMPVEKYAQQPVTIEIRLVDVAQRDDVLGAGHAVEIGAAASPAAHP